MHNLGPDKMYLRAITCKLQSFCFDIIAISYNIFQPIIEIIEKKQQKQFRNKSPLNDQHINTAKSTQGLATNI